MRGSLSVPAFGTFLPRVSSRAALGSMPVAELPLRGRAGTTRARSAAHVSSDGGAGHVNLRQIRSVHVCAAILLVAGVAVRSLPVLV